MATLRQVLVGRPWWHSPVFWIAIIVALAAVGLLSANATVWNNPAVPSLPSLQGETNQPVAQPVQQAPVVAPIKEWPKVEVVWSEPFLINSLADLPPSLPAGKGFVRETPNGIMNASSSPEAQAYLKKILPQFLPEDARRWPVSAGVARDPLRPEIVLAGFWTGYANPEIRVGERGEFYGFLFLSIDGEKSWYEISSFISDQWNNSLYDIRVVRDGENVVLFAGDPNFAAPMWRKAVLSVKSLP